MKTLSSLVLAGALAAGSAMAGDWQKLLDPAGLAALDGVTVIDIRAPDAYAAGHVEGALNAPYGSWRGPAENPGATLSDAALTERLQSLGLTPESAVVVTYAGDSPTDFGAAARVYWTLKSAGLTRLAILNGGIAAWQAAGQPLSTEPATAERSDVEFTLSDEWMIDADGVQAVIDGTSEAVLVDARPLDFFEGRQSHPAARRPGTLGGALNLTHDEWFAEGDVRVSGEAPVAARLAALGRAEADDRPLVSFCNTGHWAATNWFMLSEVAGIEGVKLYPESMVGWTLGDLPVVNGG